MRSGTFSAIAVVLCLVFAGTAHGWGVEYAKGPDPAVAEWPTWPYPTGCLGTTFDPVATFSGPTEAELGAGAPERALKGYLDEGIYAQVPTKFWRLVSSTPTHVDFASGRLAQGLFWLGFDLVGGRWQVAGNAAECRVRSLSEGRDAMDWSVPAGKGLGPKSSRVWVKLHYKRGCDGGRSLNQAAEPEFRTVAGKLVLTIWIRPLPPGPHTCQARIEPPLALKLPGGRLGKRRLWNGSTYPPRRAR